MSNIKAEKWIREFLKTELKRRKVSYLALVSLLNEDGVDETYDSLRKKMSRGSFSAVFFIRCLRLIGTKSIKIDLPLMMMSGLFIQVW